jgi:hypothetical protein
LGGSRATEENQSSSGTTGPRVAKRDHTEQRSRLALGGPAPERKRNRNHTAQKKITGGVLSQAETSQRRDQLQAARKVSAGH